MIRVARRFLFQKQGRNCLKFMNIGRMAGADEGMWNNGKAVVFGQCSLKL
jgi:hypothetical protein